VAVYQFIFNVIFLSTYSVTGADQSDLWLKFIDALIYLALPTTFAIAILRYRLFDIHVIIRKTLVYTLLSGLLALVYFGMVVLLQNIFGRSMDEQSPLIIVVSTLLIAALFAPLRQRVQAFIDRRFFRKKYDAQQILAQFAQTTRDEVSLEALTAELVHVVQDTMQPDIVSMWLPSAKQQ
jgi:RsiW-degrading membrane proteinase PrsW (M82 family)